MATDYQLAILKRNDAYGIEIDNLEDGTVIAWVIDHDGKSIYDPGRSFDTEPEAIAACREWIGKQSKQAISLS